VSSIVRNSIFMGLFNIFGRASGLIRYLLLVSLLSADYFSIISYAFSFGRLGRHFTDGGLDNLLSRDGARDVKKVPEYIFHGLVMKALLGVCFLFGAYFYLTAVRDKGAFELMVIYTALGGSVMLSLTGVLRSGFTAIERMEYVFYTNLPSRLISIVVLVGVLYWGAPLFCAAAAVSVENLIWFVLLGGVTIRFFSLRSSLSFSTITYMISESWSLALYGFFNVFYLSLDVVMIDALMGIEFVGPYTYASQLIEGITMVVSGYLIAIYPVLSRTYKTDETAYHNLFRQAVVVLGCITLPAATLLSVWSYSWMGLIPHNQAVSGQVLRVLAITMNLSMLNTLIIVVFTSRNRQRWLVLFTGGAVATSFISNWLLIPIYGQAGAAYASLISQCILFVVMGSIAIKLFDLRIPVGRPLAILSISVGAGGAVWLIPGLPLYLVPVLFGVFLLALVWLTGVMTVNDFNRLRKVIKL